MALNAARKVRLEKRKEAYHNFDDIQGVPKKIGILEIAILIFLNTPIHTYIVPPWNARERKGTQGNKKELKGTQGNTKELKGTQGNTRESCYESQFCRY